MRKTIKYSPAKIAKEIRKKTAKGEKINTGDSMFMIRFSRDTKSKKDS